jgi:hypothetical protein
MTMRACITSLTDPAWRRLHAHQKAFAEDLFQMLMSQIRPSQKEKRDAVSARVQKFIDSAPEKPRLVIVEPDCQPVAVWDFGELFDNSEPFAAPDPRTGGSALVIALLNASARENIEKEVRPLDFFEDVVERSGRNSHIGAWKIEGSLPLLCLDGVSHLGAYDALQGSILLAQISASQHLSLPGVPTKVLEKGRRSALLAALFSARFWGITNSLETMTQSDGSPLLDHQHRDRVRELFSETIENL